MHTLAKNAHHNERLIIDFLEKAYPNGVPDIPTLIKDNIINGTQLIELAVSKVDNIPLCENGDHRDLVDDSDVKTVTVQKVTEIKRVTLKTGKTKRYKIVRYCARVRDIDKKVGVLRIISWNPFTEKYNYFRIPPDAIFGVKQLNIAYDKETLEPTGQYKEFVVDSFEDVCTRLSKREFISTLISNVHKDNATQIVERLINYISTNIQERSETVKHLRNI
jgi:hypothetical protein